VGRDGIPPNLGWAEYHIVPAGYSAPQESKNPAQFDVLDFFM
jgi:hypothetical protein